MLNQNEIHKMLVFMERILEENPIEYLPLSCFGIKGMNVIEYLKSTNQYDDSEYIKIKHYLTNHYFSDEYHRSEIKEEELILYSFSDLEGYFTKEERLTATGYKLASEFLVSEFCLKNQYTSFLNTVLACAESVELSEQDKKEWQYYMKNI